MNNPFRILSNLERAYRDRYEPEQSVLLLRASWYLSLSCALVIILGGIVYGVFSLQQALAALGYSSSLETNIAPTLNRQALLSTVDHIHTRASAFDAQRAAPATVADPK